MKKKVLFVIGSELANAGVPNVIMQITRRLHEEFDFDVIVASQTKGYYDEEFKSFGGNIFVKPYKNVHFIKKGKQVFDAVSDVLKSTKYDIIHCQSGIENGPALKAAYKYGVPVRISHAHGTYLNNGKNVIVKLYKHMRMKMGVKYSTHRLACSDIAGQTLFIGKDFQNILNPIDLDYYSNIQKNPHEGIHLVQIGYYNSLKNQIFSLKVLEYLLTKGEKVFLDFVGYDTGAGYMNALEDQIKEKNLYDFVRMLPSDYDKKELFSQADFLLLPSKSEGLSLVALESQASDVFCIASTGVPCDVDMGLFERISITDPNAVSLWGDWIIKNKSMHKKVNKDKISSVDINTYLKKIKNAYNGNIN